MAREKIESEVLSNSREHHRELRRNKKGTAANGKIYCAVLVAHRGATSGAGR